MSTCLAGARAEASRRNGAKSKGPKTPEGKARSAQNALRHGFRAQKHIVLPGEGAAEFIALEAELMEELAPRGALQAALAQRVVSAVWRLSRAERLEADLFAENQLAGWSLGHALIRDCNGGARSFDTLLRYRSGALAELWRALRTLKALQAEQAARPASAAASGPLAEIPIEPEAHRIAGQISPASTASTPGCAPDRPAEAPSPPHSEAGGARRLSQAAAAGATEKKPIEPEAPRKPGALALLPSASERDEPAGYLASKPGPCDRQRVGTAEGHHGDPTGGAQPNHAR